MVRMPSVPLYSAARPGHDPHAQPGVDHEAQRVVAGDLDAQLQRQPIARRPG